MMQTPPHPSPPPAPRWPAPLRALARFGMIAALVVLGLAGFDWLSAQMAQMQQTGGAHLMIGALVAILLAYAVLLAIPFVPGVEIGLALLVLAGAQVAPFVYLATWAGLAIAFCLGQYLALGWLARGLRDLRLLRLAAKLEQIAAQDQAARLHAIQDRLPRALAKWGVKYRYLAIALAINMPGNIAIGGGGGIMLAAGVSRLFATPLMLVLLAFATAPVPLAVWLIGPDILPHTG